MWLIEIEKNNNVCDEYTLPTRLFDGGAELTISEESSSRMFPKTWPLRIVLNRTTRMDQINQPFLVDGDGSTTAYA